MLLDADLCVVFMVAVCLLLAGCLSVGFAVVGCRLLVNFDETCVVVLAVVITVDCCLLVGCFLLVDFDAT